MRATRASAVVALAGPLPPACHLVCGVGDLRFLETAPGRAEFDLVNLAPP